MDFIAGIDPTMLAALGGGLVAVIAIGFGARALFGKHKDEVIERLERATSGGMDVSMDRERAPERAFARIASILRPFARLVKPPPGEEMSRLNRSLMHAGYRSDNIVEVFLGIKLLLPPVVSCCCGRSTRTSRSRWTCRPRSRSAASRRR